MGKRYLEHCPKVVDGEGMFLVVHNSGDWQGKVGRHTWVDGVLGGGTPVDSYELMKVRAGGGLFSWFAYEPDVHFSFPPGLAPVAYVPEPDSEPEPEPEHGPEKQAEPKKRRGRPKKKR